jgi:hypothetical protein
MAIDWPAMNERGPQVTEAAIAAFEAALPEDYRAFLLAVNGGRTTRSHRVFTMQMRRVREDETVLNSLNSLNDSKEQFDLATQWRWERTWLPREVIPVGYDDFGGTVVVVIAGPRRARSGSSTASIRGPRAATRAWSGSARRPGCGGADRALR